MARRLTWSRYLFRMSAGAMQTADAKLKSPIPFAGLDFPSAGPQHAYLNSTWTRGLCPITDDEALASSKTLCRHEAIIPALNPPTRWRTALKMMR